MPVEQVLTVGFPGKLWDDADNLPIFQRTDGLRIDLLAPNDCVDRHGVTKIDIPAQH